MYLRVYSAPNIDENLQIFNGLKNRLPDGCVLKDEIDIREWHIGAMTNCPEGLCVDQRSLKQVNFICSVGEYNSLFTGEINYYYSTEMAHIFYTYPDNTETFHAPITTLQFNRLLETLGPNKPCYTLKRYKITDNISGNQIVVTYNSYTHRLWEEVFYKNITEWLSPENKMADIFTKEIVPSIYKQFPAFTTIAAENAIKDKKLEWEEKRKSNLRSKSTVVTQNKKAKRGASTKISKTKIKSEKSLQLQELQTKNQKSTSKAPPQPQGWYTIGSMVLNPVPKKSHRSEDDEEED